MKFYTATLMALALGCSLNLNAEDAKEARRMPPRPAGERPNFERVSEEFQQKRALDRKENIEFREKYNAAKTEEEKNAVLSEFNAVVTKRMQEALAMQKEQLKKMSERVAEQEKNLSVNAEKMAKGILTREMRKDGDAPKRERGERKRPAGAPGKAPEAAATK